MFKAAVLDGSLQKSPCPSTRLPTIEDEAVIPLKTETVQRLAKELWRPYRPMVVFCAATGLRSSELRGFTWSRVARNPAWGPLKTKASLRRIHIGDHSAPVLKELRDGENDVGGLVFSFIGLGNHPACSGRGLAAHS
jgi:integrase